MKILVINAGSTSIKFKFFENQEELLMGQLSKEAHGVTKKIIKNGEKQKSDVEEYEFENAAQTILEITDSEIDKIGFRIVHGAEKFVEPTLLTSEVIEELERISDLAPLHNPPALRIIRQFKEKLPEINMYGVFDTAFHATIPQKAYMYGLPYEYYENYGVRKYGFHGISHKYVSGKLKELEPTASKTIICHLGGGSSITAVKSGKSIENSMGFTPLEGLIMATRSGDVDDGAIFYLHKKLGFDFAEIEEIENKKSGMIGISGISDDMVDLLAKESEGNERAHLAIEMYIYRIQKYIGFFAAALEGIDSVVFTGGIGAGSDVLRKRIMKNFLFLNFEVDDSINDEKINVSENLKISVEPSKPIWVIPTNEEMQILKEIGDL